MSRRSSSTARITVEPVSATAAESAGSLGVERTRQAEHHADQSATSHARALDRYGAWERPSESEELGHAGEDSIGPDRSMLQRVLAKLPCRTSHPWSPARCAPSTSDQRSSPTIATDDGFTPMLVTAASKKPRSACPR